jgi:hypothetical protein
MLFLWCLLHRMAGRYVKGWRVLDAYEAATGQQLLSKEQHQQSIPAV